MHFVPSMAPQRRSADIAKEVADNIKTLGKGLLRSGTTWKAVSRRNVTVICMISRSSSGFSTPNSCHSQSYGGRTVPILREANSAIEEKIESITHKYGLESRWDLAFYLGSWKSFTSCRKHWRPSSLFANQIPILVYGIFYELLTRLETIDYDPTAKEQRSRCSASVLRT